jgi:hypothetical protein
LNPDAPEPQLQGLEPVFRCNILHADHTPLKHHFHEFQVNTRPDPKDLIDGVEDLPDLLDIEESDEEEDNDQDWYSDIEEEGDEDAQVETRTRTAEGATPGEERSAKHHYSQFRSKRWRT